MEFLKTSWANMVDVEENEALTQKDSEGHNQDDGF